jgi:hypothetical protein
MQSYSHRLHEHDLVNFNPADVLTGSGAPRQNYGICLGHLMTLTKIGGTCSTHKVCTPYNSFHIRKYFNITDNIHQHIARL